MKRILLTLILVLAGCGKLTLHHPMSPAADVRLEALRSLYGQNLQRYNDATKDRAGWPSAIDCDGTVWAGDACDGGATVDISLAEFSPGELHRRPKASGACWTKEKGDVGSKSTMSRDDLWSYMACAWRRQDLGAFQRLGDYGEAHAWQMGQPDLEYVHAGTSAKGVIGRAIYALSAGQDDRSYRDAFEVPPPGVEDYQKHVEAIEIDLMGRVHEATRVQGLDLDLDSWEIGLVEVLHLDQPKDQLFQAVWGTYSGDMSPAISLLLDPAAPAPSYVRGKEPELFALAHWLKAARIVLNRFEGQ